MYRGHFDQQVIHGIYAPICGFGVQHCRTQLWRSATVQHQLAEMDKHIRVQ